MQRLSGKIGNASTLEEVIWQLDEVIKMSIQSKSKLGYFASLYRMVTVRVSNGILNNQFDDGARMARLDVSFANFYLNALNDYLSGRPTSLSWQMTFRYAQSRRPIVLQHLLLGINVHINLDLGVAAANTGNSNILSLHHDFMIINNILESLVDEVRSDMEHISPWIAFLDHIDSNASKAIINFSLKKARDYAWNFAQTLATAEETDWKKLIKVKDKEIAGIGNMIVRPGNWLLKAGLWAIRLRESNNIVRNIDLLNNFQLETKKEGGIHLL